MAYSAEPARTNCAAYSNRSIRTAQGMVAEKVANPTTTQSKITTN